MTNTSTLSGQAARNNIRWLEADIKPNTNIEKDRLLNGLFIIKFFIESYLR